MATSCSVMMSLKAFAPVLASALGTTPAAIYERQRALVRAHLLPAPIGRGRGNGLPARAETVALMIIALMVTDNLSDTDGRVKRLANAKIDLRTRKGCRLTGAQNFRAALVAILGSEDLAAAVTAIRVSRRDLYASIYFELGRDRRRFHTRYGQEAPFPNNLEIDARLKGSVVKMICEALQTEKKGV
jgi:hypothetical protein